MQLHPNPNSITLAAQAPPGDDRQPKANGPRQDSDLLRELVGKVSSIQHAAPVLRYHRDLRGSNRKQPHQEELDCIVRRNWADCHDINSSPEQTFRSDTHP